MNPRSLNPREDRNSKPANLCNDVADQSSCFAGEKSLCLFQVDDVLKFRVRLVQRSPVFVQTHKRIQDYETLDSGASTMEIEVKMVSSKFAYIKTGAILFQ